MPMSGCVVISIENMSRKPRIQRKQKVPNPSFSLLRLYLFIIIMSYAFQISGNTVIVRRVNDPFACRRISPWSLSSLLASYTKPLISKHLQTLHPPLLLVLVGHFSHNNIRQLTYRTPSPTRSLPSHQAPTPQSSPQYSPSHSSAPSPAQ